MQLDVVGFIEHWKMYGRNIGASQLVLYYDNLNRRICTRFIHPDGVFRTLDQALQTLRDDPHTVIMCVTPCGESTT